MMERIRNFAMHDDLTGLPNRRHVNQPLSDAINQHDMGTAVKKAFILIDIGFFKFINDIAGRFLSTYQNATDIQAAADEGRLEVHYQPIVDLEKGEVLHFEALIRMRDRSGTYISAGSFIPTAERLGLVSMLDRWMITSVIGVLRTHREEKVFINLSPLSLSDQTFLDEIESLLRANRDVVSRLGIEITENAAMYDLESTHQWMTNLRQVGCRFALDDFGIGFTSLWYIRNLPVEYVKIDGSFVQNVDSDMENRALVEAISTMCRALGKRVIAEWVETASVMNVLTEYGVQYGQGHFWGRPGPNLTVHPLK